MAQQIQRWLLLVFSLCFFIASCLNFAQALMGEFWLGHLFAGLFYLVVGHICMGAHIRNVVGELDDEESVAS
jgi:hypothetical protein